MDLDLCQREQTKLFNHQTQMRIGGVKHRPTLNFALTLLDEALSNLSLMKCKYYSHVCCLILYCTTHLDFVFF